MCGSADLPDYVAGNLGGRCAGFATVGSSRLLSIAVQTVSCSRLGDLGALMDVLLFAVRTRPWLCYRQMQCLQTVADAARSDLLGAFCALQSALGCSVLLDCFEVFPTILLPKSQTLSHQFFLGTWIYLS